jgi:transcriptional regulator with XRE-family HTH domain
MEQNIALANRLKELCEQKNLSYNELAEESGLPQSPRPHGRHRCRHARNHGVLSPLQG